MSTDVVIKVENLSKRYTLRHHADKPADGLRHVLQAAVTAPFKALGRRSQKAHPRKRDGSGPRGVPPGSTREEFWALKDVSLEVRRGEATAIIGRNGAGKSTFLKILSRITEPTRGRIGINGRVASLLEVGTGFHPELTGRENVFLNGAILGMTRQEVRRKFDEIVCFARVEKFLDTAVKHYSSGMSVRLAFAVAAHLEPDILVVDEVLAVGDAAFQKKCLGKMGEVTGQGGRTVLFVSHNMQAVSTLCSRAILLEEGRIAKAGAVTDVVNGYLATALGDAQLKREQVWDEISQAPGNDKLRLRRIAVISEGQDPYRVIDMTTPFRVEVDYWNLVANTPIVLNLGLYTVDGSPVFESLTATEPHWHGRRFPKGLFRSVCSVPGHLLNEGDYTVRITFSDDVSSLYDHPDAAAICIANTQLESFWGDGRFFGPVHPSLFWRTEFIDEYNPHPSIRSGLPVADLL